MRAEYLRASAGAESLSRDEEQALLEHWSTTRDPRAASTLLRAHLPNVVAIALKNHRYGVPLDELVAEGNFGLVRALQKFDPARGTRFVTYASYWIRAYIVDYVLRSWSVVSRGTALRSSFFFKLRRERSRLLNLVGDPTRADELLAEKHGVSVDEIARLERRDVSLDAPLHDGAATSWLDTLAAPGETQEWQLVLGETRRRERIEVRNAIERLDPRERYIIEHRGLVEDDEALSLTEIGRRFGISRERAHQLEKRAREKLRRSIGGASGSVEAKL